MAYTALSDLKLPESMAADIINESVENSRFFQSGAIVDLTASLEAIPSKGKVLMPFWNDLADNTQVAHHGVDLTVGAVTQGQDQAAVLSRAGVWGAEDLAAAFKGEDPVAFIQERVVNWWANQLDRIAAQNVLAAAATTVSGYSMASNVLDISSLTAADRVIDDDAMIDTAGLLGDKDEDLSLVIMHSATRRLLEKQGVVEDFVPADGPKAYKMYRGRPIVTTDRLAPSSGTYKTILLGAGALAYFNGAPKKPAEIHREPLLNGGEEAFISRRIFGIHPRGIAFAATPAGDTATDAELSTASNWQRVWTAKNVKIAVLVHKLA